MPGAAGGRKPKSSLSAKEKKALTAKFSISETLFEPPAPAVHALARAGAARMAEPGERRYYPDFEPGRFEGEPTLVWLSPDRFLHLPRPEAPFRYIRHDGAVIEPGRMFTDGGSIPRALWSFKDFSPWTYGPAFLIHDWLFDLHHCGRDQLGFEEVRDIMLEGVKTLMESGVCPFNRIAFDAIYAGIDSPIARALWNKPGCNLP